MGEGFDAQAAGKAGFQRETHRFNRQRAEDPGHDETFGHTHCKHEQHTNPRQQNPGTTAARSLRRGQASGISSSGAP